MNGTQDQNEAVQPQLTWCSLFSTAGSSPLQPLWQTVMADALASALYALAHAGQPTNISN